MGDRVAALGLDVGRKRVGVAGCDGTGLIATGITTIARTSFASRYRMRVVAIVEEREITLLVVGLPYSMSGNLGSQAKEVQKFTKRVATALNLPVEYVDERLTSVEAEMQLKAQKRFSTYNKGMIDKQAAKIILQQWLDERRQRNSRINKLNEE
ncbi:putative pre-16S rRNA nuclease [Hyella patelloides LEGE 07179]|uniref:Putative pre-16S rRNA nuclease n=1 Tax=Hyella patelloides LEGE 07179 TaxID=945734 RepID=A0A563W3S7_9CYAN|nr:Holliday junction resolvase RuvX [Hyella patelloides]VEP18328.1 putative pre-16S rRNA nuclease [Hyella patelloides LEGE 07179]